MGIRTPRNDTRLRLWRTIGYYLVCYAAWLAFSVVGFVLLLSLRTNLFDLSIWLEMNPWAVRAVERFAIFVLGLFWFAGIIILESYLRSGIIKKQLWQRIARVAIALAGVLAISYSLQVFTIF
jgi:hypothetical protein